MPDVYFQPVRKELFVLHKLARRFTARHGLCVKLLDAFQGAGWPAWMDDPLEYTARYKTKQRAGVLKQLNFGHDRIRFFTDGESRIGWVLGKVRN